ncbi:MAG: hypothetical protein MJB14_21315 [Spirochaetes bacterium]|nr:hypothetical protein [Spirochaetota bacterium]
MKSILNKLWFFIFIIPLLSAVSESSFQVDTVNFRKDFFLNEKNWSQYINRPQIKEENNKKVQIWANFNNGMYAICFCPLYKDFSQTDAFGKIIYLFNNQKELLEVKVYFLENRDSYLLFTKQKARRFEIKLFGTTYRSNLPYHFEFEALKFLSLNDILSVLKLNHLDDELLISYADNQIKLNFIDQIIFPLPDTISAMDFQDKILAKLTNVEEKKLLTDHYQYNPQIDRYELLSYKAKQVKNRLINILYKINYLGNFSEDGARNHMGDFVSIDSGEMQTDHYGFNCSGYVKEIMDNYLRVLVPEFKWLSIEDLKAKRLAERNVDAYRRYEYTNDPYFGSDWVRNIIDKTNEVADFKLIKAEELTNDPYAAYFPTYGYYLENLDQIFFRDQQKSSDFFYILVFNRLRSAEPIVPEFYHMAIVVPYFRGKKFLIRVFESGRETSYNQLIKNQIPQYFSTYNFNEVVLSRLENKDDLKFMEQHYLLSKDRKSYYLKSGTGLDQAVRILRILSRIEYKNKKVLIFKVPIKMTAFIAQN